MHRRFFLLLAAFFNVLFLLSCSEQPTALNKLSRDAVIVAFGDSLTFGSGAKDHESYPRQLAQLINRDVINEGIPGELSGEGLRRLPTVLEEHQPE